MRTTSGSAFNISTRPLRHRPQMVSPGSPVVLFLFELGVIDLRATSFYTHFHCLYSFNAFPLSCLGDRPHTTCCREPRHKRRQRPPPASITPVPEMGRLYKMRPHTFHGCPTEMPQNWVFKAYVFCAHRPTFTCFFKHEQHSLYRAIQCFPHHASKMLQYAKFTQADCRTVPIQLRSSQDCEIVGVLLSNCSSTNTSHMRSSDIVSRRSQKYP